MYILSTGLITDDVNLNDLAEAVLVRFFQGKIAVSSPYILFSWKEVNMYHSHVRSEEFLTISFLFCLRNF